MLIEIHGGGFKNKGAELMLDTVVAELKTRLNEVQFCMAARNDRPFERVAAAGGRLLWPSYLYTSSPKRFRQFYRISQLLGTLYPRRLLMPYGLCKHKEVDAIIDISGYAFGDLWGTERMVTFSRIANWYRRNGKPVIMLPQMFGPFDKQDSKSWFESVCSNVDLIYARDKTSLRLAQECTDEKHEVKLAPDITMFNTSYKKSDEFNDDVDRVVLVPNIHVLDMGSTNWDFESYVGLFVDAAKQVLEAGKEITIVVHDYFGGDIKLAEKIADELGLSRESIFQSQSAHQLKALIGNSQFIVASRFHSLVAALSTNTPAISIGWAHKYNELMSDFNVQEFNIKNFEDSTRVANLVEKLLDKGSYEEAKNRIACRYSEMREDNNRMWSEVLSLLQNNDSNQNS